MGSWKTEEGVAATQTEKRDLVDPETHRYLFEENRAGCLGTPWQRELGAWILCRWFDQDHKREQGFEAMGREADQKKGR